MCDERVWRSMLGDESAPGDVYSLASEDTAEFTRDISESGADAVWLVGEQRWSTM